MTSTEVGMFLRIFAGAKDWVTRFGEDSRDFLALWNTQWLHLAKRRKKKIIHFFFFFEQMHSMTGGDRVYFCLHLTRSISQDQVVLRSCCQTGTFILRFRSSGNILCKLSTSFALEHFLRLLPFLWWYHTVKLKTLNNNRLSQGQAGKCTNHQNLTLLDVQRNINPRVEEQFTHC